MEKGDIVKFNGGWYRISAITKTTVNLAGIFSGVVTHKRVPIEEVIEDAAGFYTHWGQSETYMSM